MQKFGPGGHRDPAQESTLPFGGFYSKSALIGPKPSSIHHPICMAAIAAHKLASLHEVGPLDGRQSPKNAQRSNGKDAHHS